MIRLITDFDGPIIDVSDRYYRVYQYCLENAKSPHQPVRKLSKAEFWQLKRGRVPERKIGMISGLDKVQGREFARLRRQTVHSLPYLVYDRLIPGAVAALEKVQESKIDLVVMTMRRRQELQAAFDQHNLEHFFPPAQCYCLENDYQKQTDVEDKPLLMERAIKELPVASEVWMVGDTEADIVAAKCHNVRSIAVLSGIRDRVQLKRYEPDLIVNNLPEAVDFLTTLFPAVYSTF